MFPQGAPTASSSLRRERGSSSNAWRGPCSTSVPRARIMMSSTFSTERRRWAITTPCSTSEPALQDQDVVDLLHRAQAMGDHHPGAALEQRLECVLDLALRDRVEPCRRLVQDHDGGIAQERARQGESLRLARGQGELPAADDSVQPCRLAGEPRQQTEPVEGCLQAAIVDRRVEQAQVVADGAAEELHLLGHHGDRQAQRRQPVLAQVHAIQRDAPGARVVEPRQQPRHRGLAAATAAEDAQGTARLDAE